MLNKTLSSQLDQSHKIFGADVGDLQHRMGFLEQFYTNGSSRPKESIANIEDNKEVIDIALVQTPSVKIFWYDVKEEFKKTRIYG